MNSYESFKLNDLKLQTSANAAEQYATDVMSNLVDVYYTDHSISHLKRILKLIDLLLRQNGKENLLTPAERYVLITSVFLHDIGMQDEVDNPEADSRRENHHKRAAELITADWQKIGLIESYVAVIALVAEGHRGNFDSRYVDKTIGTGDVIRAELLAALLHLGDELDVSSERVDIKKKHLLKHDSTSATHFYKHYYTQGITIGDDRCLRIAFRYPSEERAAQYRPIFEPIVLKKIDATIQSLVSILQAKHKIFLALTKESRSHDIVGSIEAINPALFEEIFAESIGVRHFLILKRLGFQKMIGDVNPELFYQGNVRWADIVNNLDISRAQYPEIRKALSRVYDASLAKQCISGLLICGEGGSGKTTILSRLAYDLACDHDHEEVNLLWLPPDCEFNYSEVRNLVNATLKPAIVFIDGIDIDATVGSIREQMRGTTTGEPVILVFAARLNEWINATGDKIGIVDLEKVQLNTLNDGEITDLLSKLEAHSQLYELTSLSPSERFSILKSKSDGQLLVAMLEATRGKRFSEIIVDEYKNIKKEYPEAATAYEIVCMFYIHDVMIPQELLISLVMCADYEDFQTRVLQRTHLIIVKHGFSKYGVYYRPRHKEIARVLMNILPDYEFGEKRLKRLAVALRVVDVADRKQRYVPLNFLNNYVTYIKKTQPSADYRFRYGEVEDFLLAYMSRAIRLMDGAKSGQHKSELIEWSKLFKILKMQRQFIMVLEKIVSFDEYDRRANYLLARELSHTRTGNANPERVAKHYKNSFLGGNRRTLFLYEFLAFCLKQNLFDEIDSVIGGFNDFISFDSHEETLKEKLQALLAGYKIRKDRTELSHRFTEIAAHLSATKALDTGDEIEYIDRIESDDVPKALSNYESHLLTISPSRPKGVILRIAHLSSHLPGEENKALSYFREYYDKHIKSSPQIGHFNVLLEYVTFAVRHRLQSKPENYSLFKLCIQLSPFYLQTYAQFAAYCLENGDKNFACEIARNGLKAASKTENYDSRVAGELKNIIDHNTDRK